VEDDSGQSEGGGVAADGRGRGEVGRHAQEDNLPVTENDVKIVRTLGEITVTVTYTIPIVFPGYTYNWHLEHEAKNPIF
jgi:hypothetical protein